MNHRTRDRGRHPLGTGHPPLGETAGNASDRLAQLTSSDNAFACVEFLSKPPHVCSYAMLSMDVGYHFKLEYELRYMERVCVVRNIRVTTCFVTSPRVGGVGRRAP